MVKWPRLQVPPFAKDFTLGENLYITGRRGKSVHAAQILTAIIKNHPVSGRWIQADKYIEALKDSFDSSNGLLGDEYSTPYLIKNLLAIYDVVVLDGLGDERKTDFAAHEIGSLIRARYDRMKTTIITSRLSIGDIALRYGERLSSPLADFDMEVCDRRQ